MTIQLGNVRLDIGAKAGRSGTYLWHVYQRVPVIDDIHPVHRKHTTETHVWMVKARGLTECEARRLALKLLLNEGETMKSEPSDLRDLADKILALAQEHPAFSQAHRVVAACTDHLTALAGYHEANARGTGRRRRRRTKARRRRASPRKPAAAAAPKVPAKTPAKATKRSRRRKSGLKLVA